MTLRDVIDALHRGDFSSVAAAFQPRADERPLITVWSEQGLFETESVALAEAFTCACFLGATDVAACLLDSGVSPTTGDGAGQTGFHCAVSGGHLETVRMLLAHRAPLEVKNRFGGTVLGQAIWSAIHEPKPHHGRIIALLIAAGADVDAAGGQEQVILAQSRFSDDS